VYVEERDRVGTEESDARERARELREEKLQRHRRRGIAGAVGISAGVIRKNETMAARPTADRLHELCISRKAEAPCDPARKFGPSGRFVIPEPIL